jgi:hypothetical protein
MLPVLVIVLLAGATCFYTFYFAAADSAVRPAENFRFRHMTVTQIAEQGVYRFFYATNRQARGVEGALGQEHFDDSGRIYELFRAGDRIIELFDVTTANLTRTFHNFSVEAPEFFGGLRLRMSNERLPRSRFLYQLATAGGRIYSVLTRGR